MRIDKKNIDLLFEEKLKGFKERPPAYAWNRLEHDLTGTKSVRYLIYLRWAAAMVLILLAFGAGYFYANYSSFPEQKITHEASHQNINSDENLSKEKPLNQNLIRVPKSDEILVQQEKTQSTHQKPKNLEDLNKNQAHATIDQKDKYAEILISENIISESKPNNDQTDNLVTDENIYGNPDIPANDETIALNEEKAWENIDLTNPEPLPMDPKAKIYGMETTKSSEFKWSVGAQVAPVWSYRDISLNYQNQTGNNVKEAESQLNDAEDALLSYAGGIDVNYFFNNRWSIQSGMVYSKIGQVNNNALSFKQENNQYLLYSIQTSTGKLNILFEKIPENIKKINPPVKDTLEVFDLNNVKVIQNIELFEVPLVVKYKIIDRKVGINVSGGLSPAYLLNDNVVLQVDNNKYNIGSSANLNSMIMNTSFSVGLNYQLTKKIRLNIEPNFKYSLSPINKNSQFDYHPYYLSLFTGINYKF